MRVNVFYLFSTLPSTQPPTERLISRFGYADNFCCAGKLLPFKKLFIYIELLPNLNTAPNSAGPSLSYFQLFHPCPHPPSLQHAPNKYELVKIQSQPERESCLS